MKLYTEEQVREAIKLAQIYDSDYCAYFKHKDGAGIVEQLASIEIPTDDDIIDLGPWKKTPHYNVIFYHGWLEGAKKIRNLILRKVTNDTR